SHLTSPVLPSDFLPPETEIRPHVAEPIVSAPRRVPSLAMDLPSREPSIVLRRDSQLLSSIASSLSALELRDIYFQMGTLLAKVHGVTLDAFGYITTGGRASHPTNEAYMRSQYHKKLVEFDAHGGDAALRRTVEEYVETHSDLLTQVRTPVLCHDDYHEGNILIDQEGGKWRVTGIIDVENAVSADPLLDIAKTDYYAIKANEAKREGFLTGHGRLPTDWRERVHLYKLYHALE